MKPALRFRSIAAFDALPAALFALLLSSPASAQMVEAGHRGSLVFDDLSGFRASTIGGVGYAGPIGVSAQSVNEATIGGVNGDTDTYHYTTFWFAPSLDVFVINHLSIGGLIEVAVTSSNLDSYRIRLNATATTTFPTTTDLTFIPRVGWLFDVTQRFGIWPRVGFGWAERQAALPNSNNSDTLQSFVIDVDCGFIYRATSDWFIRAAPEFTIGPGSHSVTTGNTETSANATLASFTFAGGFGYMWNR